MLFLLLDFLLDGYLFLVVVLEHGAVKELVDEKMQLPSSETARKSTFSSTLP